MPDYGGRNSGLALRSGAFQHLRETGMGFWAYAPVAAALVLRLASGPTANLSYLALAAYALLSRAHAIRALALSWLFTMISPGIAPEASAGAVGRYAVLFAAAASAIVHSSLFSSEPRLRPFTLATLLLGLFIMCHSLLFSPIPDVSVLKAVSWTLAMTTLLSAWCSLSEQQMQEMSQQLFWGLVLVLLASLPLAASSLGYMRNGMGFQGILNQPQAFGPTMALLCAWTTSRLFGEARPSWWLLGVAGASLTGISLSEARTAGFAIMLGVGCAVLLGPGVAGKPIRLMLPGMSSARVWAVFGAVLVACVVMAPTIDSAFQRYISKSGRARLGGDQVEGVMEAYDRSRGRLIDAMLENIAQHPLTGIGFGIASEPATMVVSRDPVLGLPVGASIEKGVAPLAVLEEIGTIGGLLVVAWIMRLLRSSARSGLAAFAVCLTVLLLNMGESTLFSAGGMGLLPLILLGWAYADGIAKSTRRG
ncbi:hypothetical protein [Pseudaminobacter soli (ex Li et al. 2025)]|uniref:O-antigen ligase domain-containing protein n=1 Tax=Pseudaminobacter soli (ex Li et al. 2025) TaxID=1295366 RepID=A0A2P7SGR6_9HYPH|nr:hypothetical protein [Mesorhizobium soli]PSJ61521.1 hypothetical protein C7I85_10755 [Mesorhizobium soli]